MSVFETTKQLTSWAELTPQNQESAGKKKLFASVARERTQKAFWQKEGCYRDCQKAPDRYLAHP